MWALLYSSGVGSLESAPRAVVLSARTRGSGPRSLPIPSHRVFHFSVPSHSVLAKDEDAAAFYGVSLRLPPQNQSSYKKTSTLKQKMSVSINSETKNVPIYWSLLT